LITGLSGRFHPPFLEKMHISPKIQFSRTCADTLLSMEEIRTADFLGTFLKSALAAAPLLGLFYLYIGANTLFGVTILAGVLLLPAFFALKSRKCFFFVANYTLFVLWAALGIIAWNTGAITPSGAPHPTWILNGALVLMALYLLSSLLWGTLWTLLVFVEMGVVLCLYRRGHLFPNLIPPDIFDLYSLGAFLVALLFIVSLAFLFERRRMGVCVYMEQGEREAIREARKFCEEVLRYIPVPTFIIDRNHRVIQWNQACAELTGIPAKKILGKKVWNGFDVDGQGSMADAVLNRFERSSASKGENTVPPLNDGTVEIELDLPALGEGCRGVISAALLYGRNGQVIGAIQTVRVIPLHTRFPLPQTTS